MPHLNIVHVTFSPLMGIKREEMEIKKERIEIFCHNLLCGKQKTFPLAPSVGTNPTFLATKVSRCSN